MKPLEDREEHIDWSVSTFEELSKKDGFTYHRIMTIIHKGKGDFNLFRKFERFYPKMPNIVELN